MASQQQEQLAVERRYQAALQDTNRRGCAVIRQEFEAWLAICSAVAARPLEEVEKLATSDKVGYPTYYDLTEAGLRLPDGTAWDDLRRAADEVLFPRYREKMRVAALSGDGVGVANFGHFWLSLRVSMIAHRASVFDQNSASFVADQQLRKAQPALQGHRAPWAERQKLAVAQLAPRLSPTTTAQDFSAVLLEQGATTDEDRYIEVNIWGPMTIRSFEKVVYSRSRVVGRLSGQLSRLKTLKRDLARFNVDLEETP